MKYTAIMIEPRKHKALELVLNNFNRNLNEDWKFIIYHGNLNKEYIEDIIERNGMKNRTRLLNLNVDNLTIEEYNPILYRKDFYDNIDTEMFLIFQTDTLLNDSCRDNVYKFMEYDYVGAPWDDNVLGNGGLSLRRKSKSLELIHHADKTNYNYYLDWEDNFFSNLMNFDIDYRKPTAIESRKFSVEKVYSINSFGLHKCWLYVSESELDLLLEEFEDLGELIRLNEE